MLKIVCAAALSVLAGAGVAAASETTTAPYAGMETRAIKALSSTEIADYLAGKGMGLARSGELNHYPGPAHVLALASELALTPEQQARTRALFQAMERDAMALGKEIVSRERQLDQLFAGKAITPAALEQSLQAIATLQSQLRRVHLQSHLDQAAMLSSEQVRQYDQLRGYGSADPAGSAHSHRPR